MPRIRPTVCAEPGCPEITPNRRCPAHERARDSSRGTRQDRGYDAHHDRERARWAKRMARGELIHCARCGEPIRPGHEWHLDHNDDRTGYLGPAHARSCNLRAAGLASHGLAWTPAEDDNHADDHDRHTQ